MRRGVNGVQLVSGDADEGLEAALEQVLTRATWQRSRAHLICNVLAYMSFPAEPWSRLYSTNPLKRLREEVRRSTNVLGVFREQASAIRLVGSVLLEIWDEWQVGLRYFRQESVRKLSESQPLLIAGPQPLSLAPVTQKPHGDPTAIEEPPQNLQHLTETPAR
jgi:transposase-like protein